MNITDQRIWQIGSGDYSRDYSGICLEYGIAMVGPGWPGNAKINPEEYTSENNWGVMLLQVKNGDIVLLRRGQTVIKAVGVVVNEYDYSISLSDIHGWDLNHYIRVEWYIQDNNEDIILPHAMIGYSTMSSVNKNYEYIKKRINGLCLKKYESTKSISNLKIPKEISIEDLNNYFIEYGLRIGDSINIADTIKKIITLVKWYRDNDFNVLEHELRTFLVVPFLFSLGWSEQKIKIEYNKIDIAIFTKPYVAGNEDDPQIIIETKTFKDGLDLAKEQISSYAENYPNCNTIVTTNGYRYNIYKKREDAYIRYAYFNLLEMRDFDYIYNNIKGVLDGMTEIINY